MNRFTIIRSLALLALSALLLISTTGCKKKDGVLPYITPIEGWNDIALPPSAEWERSSISGKVENHYFNVPMIPGELFTFTEGVMEQNGWTLSKTVQDGRTFMKEGDQMEISTNSQINGETNFIIVIEPKGAYDKVSP